MIWVLCSLFCIGQPLLILADLLRLGCFAVTPFIAIPPPIGGFGSPAPGPPPPSALASGTEAKGGLLVFEIEFKVTVYVVLEAVFVLATSFDKKIFIEPCGVKSDALVLGADPAYSMAFTVECGKYVDAQHRQISTIWCMQA